MRWLNDSSLASRKLFTTVRRATIATALLPAVFACSSTNETPDASTPVDASGDAGVVVETDSGTTPTPDGGFVFPDAEPLSEECQKPANVARREELLAAQPALAVRTKQVIAVNATFPSLADDPSVECSVGLAFKDSNANDTLDEYEDWRLASEARATDLVARMTVEEKVGLLAHPLNTDRPTSAAPAPSAALQTLLTDGHIRFVQARQNSASIGARASWANAIQELVEAENLGIPVVLSSEPAHHAGNGRTKAQGFSVWPNELSLAAAGDSAVVEEFGRVVAQEYRAIGIRMALSGPADLFTDPRWNHGQFTFGEDSAAVGDLLEAYVQGLQGESLGKDSVAVVVGHFPGAGAAKEGWDARLAKGKYLTFSGTSIDGHLAPFAKAITAGAAGMMPAYAIAETGSWTGLGGQLDGTTIEQVGASFNSKLLTDVLRTHYQFGGLVVAPIGILEDAGTSPLGTPWGMESSTKAQRIGKAIAAGVDNFQGFGDFAALLAAKTAGDLTDAQLDGAAKHALALMFQLGLFENPYVDAARAPSQTNTDASYRAGLRALDRGYVMLKNADKPAGWLNGQGDGTQTGDKGNAGNGSRKVLPAPPGEPYVVAGCSYFIAGHFDLDYIRSVSTGYGELTNDATSIKEIPVSTPEERIPLSDYVFFRLDTPFTQDPDAGNIDLPLASLSWMGAGNAAELGELAAIRAAIDASPTSKTQIIVGIDAGRLPLVDEILAYGVSALFVSWEGRQPDNQLADKIYLDVAFGLVPSAGTLPVGLPASEGAAASQRSDLPGDGQHATFVRNYGLDMVLFQ